MCPICNEERWVRMAEVDYVLGTPNECPICGERVWVSVVQYEEGEGEALRPLHKLKARAK